MLKTSFISESVHTNLAFILFSVSYFEIANLWILIHFLCALWDCMKALNQCLCVNVCKFVYALCVCVFICVNMCVFFLVWIRFFIISYDSVCVSVYVECVCVCVCMRVYVYVCLFVFMCVCVFIYSLNKIFV